MFVSITLFQAGARPPGVQPAHQIAPSMENTPENLNIVTHRPQGSPVPGNSLWGPRRPGPARRGDWPGGPARVGPCLSPAAFPAKRGPPTGFNGLSAAGRPFLLRSGPIPRQKGPGPSMWRGGKAGKTASAQAAAAPRPSLWPIRRNGLAEEAGPAKGQCQRPAAHHRTPEQVLRERPARWPANLDLVLLQGAGSGSQTKGSGRRQVVFPPGAGKAHGPKQRIFPEE